MPAPTVPTASRRPTARRWWVPLTVIALLSAMAFAMITAAGGQTPTTDEPVYAGTAVVYAQQHSLRYNTEHPPLGKLLMAAGLAFAEPRLDPAFPGDEWALGRHLLYESGNDAQRLIFLARLPVIVLALLAGLVVFAFARDLAGTRGGLVALVLYAVNPDVIAHGSLATLDLPVAAFLLTTMWLLWRGRMRPRLYLPLAGVALGAALATKMNVLPVVPVMVLLAVLAYRHAARPTLGWVGPTLAPGYDNSAPPSTERPSWRAAGAAGMGVAAIAVAVVWVSYLVVDPRLRGAPGVPSAGGVRGLLATLLPLPAPYRDGLRFQFALEDNTWGGFLFGHAYEGSLWYYLPTAVLVKTPIGLLALGLAGTVLLLSTRRAAALYLLLPPAVLFVAAMTGTRDFGVRYVLFLPMVWAIAAANLTTLRWWQARAGTAALVAWAAVSAALAHPYYLPYSNEAFGGPAKTWQRLHDSNSDWGQDLARTADRLRTRYAGQHVWLVYQGGGVPEYYGLRAGDPLTVPPDQVHGLLVVSNDRIDRADDRLRALLATSTPIDQVGYSMTIFRRP